MTFEKEETKKVEKKKDKVTLLAELRESEGRVSKVKKSLREIAKEEADLMQKKLEEKINAYLKNVKIMSAQEILREEREINALKIQIKARLNQYKD